MASVRLIKKDIEYLIDEVVGDCYLTIYFHPDKEAAVVGVMREAVDLRNDLIARCSSPAEKHNQSLVKKHYSAIRRELMQGVDTMFAKLSEVCKK